MAEDGQSDHIYSAVRPPVAKSKAAIYHHVQQTDSDGVKYKVTSPGPPSSTPTPPPPPFHRSPSGGSGGKPEAMLRRQSPEMGSYIWHMDSSRSSSRPSSRGSSAGRPSPRSSPAPPPAHTGHQRVSPASFSLSNHGAGPPLAVVSGMPIHPHHLPLPGAAHPALRVSPIPRITISPSPEMLAVSALEQQQQLNAALMLAAQQRAAPHPFPLPVPGAPLPHTAGLLLDSRPPPPGLTSADSLYLAGAARMMNMSPHSKPPRLSPVSSAPTVTDASQTAPKLSPQYAVRLESAGHGPGLLRRTPPPSHFPTPVSTKESEVLLSKPRHHASPQRSSVSPAKLQNDALLRHHAVSQPPAYSASHPVTLSSVPPPRRQAVAVQKVLNQPIAHSTPVSSRMVENQTFFQRLQQQPAPFPQTVSSSRDKRSHAPRHPSPQPPRHVPPARPSSEAATHKGRPPPVAIPSSINAMPHKVPHTEHMSRTQQPRDMLAHPISNLVEVTRTNHNSHTTSTSQSGAEKHRTVSHPHSIEEHILNTTLHSKTSKATVIPAEGRVAVSHPAVAQTTPSHSMQASTGGPLAASDSAPSVHHSYCRSAAEVTRPPIPNGEVHRPSPDQPAVGLPIKVEQTSADSKEDWQPMVSFPFNMRVHNLNNFPAAQTSYRATYRSHTIAIHRSKAGSITSAAKSLDLLRQNLQQHINKELQAIITTYVDLFFKPGLDNIKTNVCDEEIVSEDHINAVCRQVLEEAKKMYGAADVRSVTPEFPDNSSETGSLAENRTLREKKDRLFRIKRRRGSSDSEASVPRRKKKGRPPLHAVSGRSTPSKTSKSNEPVKKEGPKWDSSRLKAESLFVMGARANKALGLGQTRGRIYIKHPEVFKYSGDADDKQWLYENHHMPATGGKAYMLLVEDVQELAETDEYRDNPGLLLHELVGFTIPEWMLTKMRVQMEALRTDQPKVPKLIVRPIHPQSVTQTTTLMVAAPVADEETIIDGDDDLDTTSQVNLRLPFSSLTDTSKTLSAGNGEASNAGSLDLLSAADDDAEAVSPFNLISGSFDDAEGSPMGNLGSPVGSDLDEGAPLSAPFQVS